MGEPAEVISAGGVVFRMGDGGAEVVLIRRARSGRWRLPKGHVKPGEPLEAAAVREVSEEAGVQATVLAEIGHSSYRYYDDAERAWLHKTVHHFLMRAEPGAHVALEADTFDAGGFYPIARAADMLHFANEREAVRKARELIVRMQGGRR